MDNTMKVTILSLTNPLVVVENALAIRIKSKKYNLLIMPNYLPILGEIDGTIEIESETDSVKYEDIVGYYVQSKNEFTLILRGDENAVGNS